MNTIRLTVTPEIRSVLDDLKMQYSPLTEPEIFKLALAELYAQKKQSSVDIQKLTISGRKYFSKWLQKKGKNISTISEDNAYSLIKNA